MTAPIPSPYQFDATKVVVFMEVNPLSDTFVQVKLNPTCYQEVLAVIERHMKHNSRGEFLVKTEDRYVYKFPDIKDIYDEENPDKEK